MKQYKELRDGFKQFINESVVVGLQPLKEAKPKAGGIQLNLTPEHSKIAEKLAIKIKRKNELIKKLGKDGEELLNIGGEIDALSRELSLLYEEYDMSVGNTIKVLDMVMEIIKKPYASSSGLSGTAAFEDLIKWLYVLVDKQDRVYISIQQLTDEIARIREKHTPVGNRFNKGNFTLRGENITEGMFSNIWASIKNYVSNAFKALNSYNNALDKIKSLLS